MLKFKTGSSDKWIVGQRNDSTDHFRFYSYGTSSDVLSIETGGDVVLGQDLRILDGKGVRFGTDEDFSIYNDGSNTTLRNSTSNQDIIFLVNDDGAANTEVMRIDASTNRLGIGTDAPGSGLHLTGADNTKSKLTLTNTAPTPDNTWSLHPIYNGQDLLLNEDSDTRVTFQAGGNVGIGTTNPQRKLVLYQGDSGQTQIQFQNVTTGSTAGDGFGVGLGADERAFLWAYDNQNIYMGSGTSGEFFNLDMTNGRVGIGTTAPTELLHIKNPSNSWNEYAKIRIGTETSDSYASEIGFHRGTSSDVDRGLFLDGSGNGNQQLKVLVNGNVGIGTATPDLKLDVTHATAAEYIATFQNSGNNNQLKIGNQAQGYLNIQGARIDNGNPYNFSLQADGGNVGIGTTTPLTTLMLESTGGNLTSGNAIKSSTMKGLTINAQEGNAHTNSLGVWFGSNGSHWSGIAGGRSNTSTWGTDLRFYTHEDNTADLTYSRERMVITSEGNVGIGVISPPVKLTVAAPATDRETIRLATYYSPVDNLARGGITWHDGAAITGQIDTRYNGTTVAMHLGSLYSGGYNTTSRMIIDGSGDVSMPYKAYAYGTINGNPTSITNNYGIALTTTASQNCTPQTNSGHGPGITITKAGFYILNMSCLYDPNTFTYLGWCVNGSQIHHWHSNHAVSSNHDAVSQIGRVLNIGDHVSIENSNQTIPTIYGNAHSSWYIAKIG